MTVPSDARLPLDAPADLPARLTNLDRQTAYLPAVDVVQVYALRIDREWADFIGVDVPPLPPDAPPERIGPGKWFPNRMRGEEHLRAHIFRSRTLRGDDAAAFADLWRGAEFEPDRHHNPHAPEYAFRCFSGGKLVFETSVSRSCGNFVRRHRGRFATYGLEPGEPGTDRFLDRLDALLAPDGAKAWDGDLLTGEPPAYPPDALEALEANEWGATDADLAALEGMTGIRHLMLFRSRVTDAGMVHVARLPELRSICLDHARVTGAGLAQLTGLRKLRELSVGCVPLDDAALAPIGEMTSLEGLQLGGCGEKWRRTAPGITDAGLASLKNLTGIRHYLYLSGTSITDAGLVHLKGMTGLRILVLDGTDVADAGLVHLAGMQELSYLRLSGTRVTDAGLAHLARCKGLRTLHLDDTAVTEAGVAEHLSGLPDLYVSLPSGKGARPGKKSGTAVGAEE